MKRPTPSDAEIAMELIEEISADAQSLHPKLHWKQSQDAICAIYRLAHWIRSPKCRKNHKGWGDPIKGWKP